MLTVSRPISLLVVALTSAATVATEVLLSRVLSVVTWYNLAFLVLSVAMLGLTSGSLFAFWTRRLRWPLRSFLAIALVVFALGLLLLTYTLVEIPIELKLDGPAIVSLFEVCAAATFPMIAGGAIVTRLMSEAPVRVSLLYAVDLAAAAGGALLPLVLLGPLSGPGALLWLGATIALCAVFVAPGSRERLPAIISSVLLVVAATRTMDGVEQGYLVKQWKGKARDVHPMIEAWNAISHIDIGHFSSGPPFLWSASPKGHTSSISVNGAWAVIDGDAGTPLTAYRKISELEFLKLDATSSAHYLRPHGTACVIGVGGGRDIASALVFGHERVVAAEINPDLVKALRDVHETVPLTDDPRLTLIVGDGREVFARFPGKCSVLQASLVDTWAATTAGAFAHAEAGLYTREAWSIFLNRLEPGGILTVSRWFTSDNPMESGRLVSLAVASLRDRGVTDPAAHIAIVAARPNSPNASVLTLLLSRDPFSESDRAAIRRLRDDTGFTLLVAPGEPTLDPLFARLLAARSDRELTQIGRAVGVETSPTSDDRPFFFQVLPASMWLHPGEILKLTDEFGARAGSARAMVTFMVSLLVVSVLAILLLGPTLWRSAQRKFPPLPGWRAATYFACLGAGFMAAEIALVQRMHVVLGTPTHALIVVLAGLLVSTGIGSALSPRYAATRARVVKVSLIAAVLLALLPFVIIGPLAHLTLAAPFAVRVIWAGSVAGMIGLVLGMLFPAGLSFVHRERGTPLALALNGATAVVASVVVTALSVWAGTSASFLFAGAMYLVAALVGPTNWPEVKASEGVGDKEYEVISLSEAVVGLMRSTWPRLRRIAEQPPSSRLWMAGWITAIVVRALWLDLVQEPSRALYSDMAGYYERSWELFHSERWSPFVTFQGLGYPLLLGLLRKLWANDPDVGIVTGWLQLGASMAALAVMVHLTRRIAGPRWAIVALFLGAIHVPWLFFNSVYMPEAPFTAVLALTGLALLRLAQDRGAHWRWVLLLGLGGAAGAWLKSLHLFIGPIAAVVWLYPLRRGWKGAARIFAGWFLALALFFWIPHGTISLVKTGRFIASPSAGGLNFVEGKCPWKENIDVDGYRYWSPLFVQLGKQNTKSWPASFLDQRFFYARGFECIAKRPIVLLESLDAIRLLVFGNRLWPAGDRGRSGWLNDTWAAVFTWPLALGVVLAFAFALVRTVRIRGAHGPPAQPLADLWLALIVPALSVFTTVWIMKSEVRFRVPFDVFFFPLAIWGWRASLAVVRAPLLVGTRSLARWLAVLGADAAEATATVAVVPSPLREPSS
jgi:hypothetical protein